MFVVQIDQYKHEIQKVYDQLLFFRAGGQSYKKSWTYRLNQYRITQQGKVKQEIQIL